MKRFLVFAIEEYYPRGGSDDFVFACDSLGEAQQRCTERASEISVKRGLDWFLIAAMTADGLVTVSRGVIEFADPDSLNRGPIQNIQWNQKAESSDSA